MSDTNIPFWKMNGRGNQIIVADLRQAATKITPEAAITLDQNEATKFDQIMEIHSSDHPDIDAQIRILNSDGSEAEACGNGTRCVVSWLNQQSPKENWLFRTKPGLLNATFESDAKITVNMGAPKFNWDEIPLEEEFSDTTGIELQVGPIDDPILHTPSVANIGNPHCVFWAPDDVWTYELEKFGPMLEHHPRFPERCNISIAQVVSPDHIIARTWERGAGITLACGSAACAIHVCAVRKGLVNAKSTVTMPGGDLEIEWNKKGHILMTGPAEFEFAGLLNPQTGEFVREAG